MSTKLTLVAPGTLKTSAATFPLPTSRAAYVKLPTAVGNSGGCDGGSVAGGSVAVAEGEFSCLEHSKRDISSKPKILTYDMSYVMTYFLEIQG